MSTGRLFTGEYLTPRFNERCEKKYSNRCNQLQVDDRFKNLHAIGIPASINRKSIKKTHVNKQKYQIKKNSIDEVNNNDIASNMRRKYHSSSSCQDDSPFISELMGSHLIQNSHLEESVNNHEDNLSIKPSLPTHMKIPITKSIIESQKITPKVINRHKKNIPGSFITDSYASVSKVNQLHELLRGHHHEKMNKNTIKKLKRQHSLDILTKSCGKLNLKPQDVIDSVSMRPTRIQDPQNKPHIRKARSYHIEQSMPKTMIKNPIVKHKMGTYRDDGWMLVKSLATKSLDAYHTKKQGEKVGIRTTLDGKSLRLDNISEPPWIHQSGKETNLGDCISTRKFESNIKSMSDQDREGILLSQDYSFSVWPSDYVVTRKLLKS